MDVSRLWEPYGVWSSLFFQDELKPTDGDHPMSLFVGREDELRRIERAFDYPDEVLTRASAVLPNLAR